MRRILLTTALFVLAFPASARSQSVAEIVWSDLKTAPGDLWYVWSAPARIDGDDVPPLLLFTGTTAFVALNDLEIQEWMRGHPNSGPIVLLEPFRHEHDALSRLGQNHWVLRGAAVGYVAGLATGQEWLREASFGCAVGNTANALPRKAVYSLISRARPQTNPDDPYDIETPGGDWGVHSFFGGHAANAFTCASFFAHRWDLGWGEPVVWALATGVAVARTADEAHWASDTFVGSAFGFMAGRLIARRHLERIERAERERDPESAPVEAQGSADAGWHLDALSATPIRAGDGAGVALSARIVF